MKDDVHRIAMSKSPFESVSAQELAGQIAAKNRAEKKLPTWFESSGIYYPQLLSIEQCSSETTAAYKATLAVGSQVLDVTGGFGVDSFFFSKVAARVTHCEVLPELSEIAAHNASVLHLANINFRNTDGIQFLSETQEQFTTIYIDPARRGKSGKVFMLRDCSPNVVEHLDMLLGKALRVIIKTSPLLDITAGVKELGNVSEVQIISVKNECKELLFILDADYSDRPLKITSVTINEELKKVSFQKSENGLQQAQLEFDSATNPKSTFENTTASESLVAKNLAGAEATQVLSCSLIAHGLKRYLYEPDVALLKSGAFDAIAELFKLEKLDLQSQLYTADHLNPKFPGRIFSIKEVLSKKDLKKQKHLVGNVIVRNYPAKAEELTKAFKIKASKEEFLIFTKVRKTGYLILKALILQHY